MHLTDEEKAILDGEHGHSKQKCLDLLVSLGEIYDAERLIDVRSVHIPGASIIGIGEAGLRFVEEMGQDDTQMLAYATTNASSMPPPPVSPEAVGLNDTQIDHQTRLTHAYEKMGAYVCNTCTPFLIGNLPCPSVKTRIIFDHFDSLYTQSCFTISKALYRYSGSLTVPSL